MTVKDQVRELVEVLDEADARLVLRYLTRLTSTESVSVTAGALVIDEDEPIDAEDLERIGRPFTPESPLWNIVGMIDSGPNGPTDVSRNKHKYLADAYADLHEEE
jgi:hypothetical protein